jgi:hypothetical protein
MTSISPQLKQIAVDLQGGWVTGCEPNRWEGAISCVEQFVVLIFARRAAEIHWAKSLPSKNNSLPLIFDIYPTSKTEPRFQFHYFCGTGAFIQNVTATLSDHNYRPPILAPNKFETGVEVPFAGFVPDIKFSLACFAKSDVIVRRHYVWGLKPQLLDGLEAPWREVLAKGRSGRCPLK